MLRTKLIDPVTGDLVRRGGGFVWITGADQVRQSVRVRLRTILGEWFQDHTIGAINMGSGPGRWFGKHVDLIGLRRSVLAEIVGTPGMGTASITFLGFTGDREITVEWSGVTSDGAALSDILTAGAP